MNLDFVRGCPCQNCQRGRRLHYLRMAGRVALKTYFILMTAVFITAVYLIWIER